MWNSRFTYLTPLVPIMFGFWMSGCARWSIWILTAIIIFPAFLRDDSKLRYRAVNLSYSLHILTICCGLTMFFLARFPFIGRTTGNLLWTTRPSMWVTKFFGLSMQVKNAERIQKTDSGIIISNHQSNLDFLTFSYLSYLRGGKTAIVCKKELKYFFTVGWTAALCRMIFVDRMSKKDAFNTLLERSRRHLTSPGKRAILICPEGTRGPGKGMLPFKRGAFELAVRLNVPILAYVTSPYPVDPPHYFYRGKLLMDVLEPIYPRVGETPQELSDRTRSAMMEVYEKLCLEVGR